MRRAFRQSFIVVVVSLVVATRSWATPILPNTSVSLVDFGQYSGPIVANTGLIPLAFGGVLGTVQEVVVADALNPFGAGDYSFVWRVTLVPGSGSVSDMALSSVDLLPLDVVQDLQQDPFPVPIVPPIPALTDSANRLTPGFIDFTFAPGLLSDGKASYLMVVRTNVTTYSPGIIQVTSGAPAGAPTTNLSASTSMSVNGFAPATPVPEPASLLLVASGIAGLARRRFRRR